MLNFNNDFLNEIFSMYNFNLQQYIGYKVISKGHINTTYVLYFDYGNKVKRFLLQEINVNVFKEPDKLMSNINKITSYALKTSKNKTKDYKNKTLRIYKSKDKKNYIKLSNNSYWRVYHYIENSISLDKSTDLKIMYQAGKVIGNFMNTFKNFDIKKLYEVIPDFHNSPQRYQQFLKSINEKQKDCKEEISFFIDNKHIPYLIQPLIDNKQMPIRVVHNDTKLNNIMFEYKSNNSICLVDLDTVMPGCICFDFGDFIRSACNSSLEDEKDLDKVIFLKDQCVAFAQGFIEKCKNDLEVIELENLINGAIIMTYECGMRFLTDYLNGNTYFKTTYKDQNLIRCKTQIHLCKQIIQHKEELEKTIKTIYINTKAS